MKKFHTYQCKTFVHEKLNTSKGIVRRHELTLAITEEIKTALRKQGIIDHIRINIKRNGQIIPTNTYILTLIPLKYLKKSKLDTQSKNLTITYQPPPPWDALSAINLGTTGKLVEGTEYVENVVSRNPMILKMNAQMKQSVRIAMKIIQLTLEHVKFLKRKKSRKWDTGKMYPSQRRGK